jgi:glycosyltransferase involved in cell wall biosynthesis/2-polyprenyl-3-methyl-5-hydroxy-6-metoxy-1,4-benzoquinol methylase
MSTRYPLDILIACDGMPFNGDTLKTESLGGSETSALQMAKALRNKGNIVTVFSHCKGKEGKYGGVTYRDFDGFLPYASTIPHDVCIIERRPDLFRYQLTSKINILWEHDLKVIRAGQVFRGPSWNIDSCFVLSEFQKKQSMEITNMPDEYYWITRNGLDLKLFKNKKGKKLKREPKKLIYGARPERGLDNLLFSIMPKLIEKDSEIKLYIAGYEHHVPEMEAFYNRLRQEATKYPKNIIWLPGLNKKDLYKHYKTAAMYVYPTGFEEIFCISCTEAMACGLPFISRDYGALRETLHPDAGVLLTGFDSDKNSEFLSQYTNTIFSLLNQPEKLKKMGEAGRKHTQSLSWNSVADEWLDKFYEIFEKNTNRKYTLASDLIFHSDIVAAKKVIETIDDVKEKQKLIEKIKPWKINFQDSKDIGELEDKNVKSYLKDVRGIDNLVKITKEKKEPHWPMLDKWLKEHSDIKTFIDYGCFTGRYAIPLANTSEDYKVYGVDISRETIDIGKEVADKILKYGNLEWIHGSHVGLKDRIKEKVDCLLLIDTLEHIPNAPEVIDILEDLVRPDGWVIIITPLGAMEADSFGKWENRIHVHEFEKPDLKDLFGRKKNFQLMYLGMKARSAIDNSAFGKISTTYQKSSVKTGRVDYNRKLLVRAPRQTVSACLIVKDEENTLGRCLQNIKPYIDEIIICDTGSTDSTKEVAKKYDAKIMDGSDPLKYGFETSRNESIKNAMGDWVLWVDSDEELKGGRNLGKYLRNNIYDGFSLRQHHLSLSPPNAFPPDFPVRIFRNSKGVRFIGKIHEHPERGLNKGIGHSTVIEDIDIAHTGYYTEDIRRKRFERNYPLLMKDRQKYPDRLLGMFFEIRDHVHMARYKLEKANGRMNSDIASHCQRAVDMYRKNFLGQSMLVHKEVVEYYSTALAFLGQGFEVSFVLAFDKQKAKLNGQQPTTIRFANGKDAEIYFSTIMRDHGKVFMSRYF